MSGLKVIPTLANVYKFYGYHFIRDTQISQNLRMIKSSLGTVSLSINNFLFLNSPLFNTFCIAGVAE